MITSYSHQHVVILRLLAFLSLFLFPAWTSTVHGRDLELTISATPDPVVAGEELVYTIAYRNVTGGACPQARLHFTLPESVGPDSGRTQTWFLQTIPPGRHGSRTIRVLVDSPLPPGTDLTTTAWVTSTGAVRCRTTIEDTTNVRPVTTGHQNGFGGPS
jgi:hypothetical protein